MKKLIVSLICSLPLIAFAQQQRVDTIDTNASTLLTIDVPIVKNYLVGDTIINLNSLNNGITSYQISKEDSVALVSNGLAVQKGGMIVLKNEQMLTKNFYFNIKTNATDKEWYENSIKIHVSNNNITLISINSDKIEMATGFRKDGKIYVVIAVSMILFFTVIFYLIFLERKVKKLEKSMNNK